MTLETIRTAVAHPVDTDSLLLIVGNQPSATLWINRLREILKSLCVLLDVEWCQRPERLQAEIVQHSLRFAQQEWRQNQHVLCRLQDREQNNARHTFRARVSARLASIRVRRRFQLGCYGITVHAS